MADSTSTEHKHGDAESVKEHREKGESECQACRMYRRRLRSHR